MGLDVSPPFPPQWVAKKTGSEILLAQRNRTRGGRITRTVRLLPVESGTYVGRERGEHEPPAVCSIQGLVDRAQNRVNKFIHILADTGVPDNGRRRKCQLETYAHRRRKSLHGKSKS